MTHNWFHIAKIEFFVLTASMKKHRMAYTTMLYALTVFWAVYLAPIVVGGIINAIIPMSQIRIMLIVVFPGLMRTVVLFLWMALLLIPLSNALQEIKIGQWEIFLSNNVRTRDIIVGMFLGKIPLYGLMVVMVSPLLISPFMLAYEVSLVGQVLVYGTLALMVLSTIWLSNFITALIQSRLGNSSRGNDIAKAVAVVIALVTMIPTFGLMFFLPAMTEIFGMNTFLALPSTWSADLISWLTIIFNGVGLTDSQIIGFESTLQFDIQISALLMGVFGLASVAIALVSADRVFTISASARSEAVTTVGQEGVVFRALRRIGRGPFGALMVVNLKDFFRKAQNLSKILSGVVLAMMLPVAIPYLGDSFSSMTDVVPTMGMVLAIVGVIPFAGTGFLESRDQLWIIQGAPSGASRFVKSRLASVFLTAIPLAAIPVTAIAVIYQASAVEYLMALAHGYAAVCGAAMVATGITARNPNYKDTKSPAHQMNVIASLLVAQFSMMVFMFVDAFLGIGLGVDIYTVIGSFLGPPTVEFVIAILEALVLSLMGAVLVFSGIRSLSRPDV